MTESESPFPFRRSVQEIARRRTLRESMRGAAIGAICRVSDELAVQKVSDTELVVAKGRKTRRVAL